MTGRITGAAQTSVPAFVRGDSARSTSAVQGWGWRLCSALSITITDAEIGTSERRFVNSRPLPVPVARVRGTTKRHKKVRYYPPFLNAG